MYSWVTFSKLTINTEVKEHKGNDGMNKIITTNPRYAT